MNRKTTPLIIFSDHPAANTGLARITRDLALRIHHEMKDEVDVACLGYGAPGSIHLPFPQYTWLENGFFIPQELPTIWKDFCGDDPGILLTIGDIQRFLQLADFGLCADTRFGEWMRTMRSTGKLKLWGYFPVDAHGIDGKLGPQLAHTLTHYDRRLVPSEWAKNIIQKTLPDHEIEAIPHGIEAQIFNPVDHEAAMSKFPMIVAPVKRWPTGLITPLDKNLFKIGVVATNQRRKSIPTAIEAAAEIKKSRPVFLWIHTDTMKREWSILELVSDLGMLGETVITTGNISDDAMTCCYSALDVLFGVGKGEGWGYPMAEALACGTPVITSDYGAQTDYVPTLMQVPSKTLEIDGPLNLYRPVYDAREWARAAIEWEAQRYEYSVLPKEFEWPNVWKRFEQWIREGVR